MLRVTGPVTSSRSAWRGDATKYTPKRSLSYTGPMRPLISSSQPLHEPASTSRIARARPNSCRARASTSCSRRRTSSPPGASGSVARPTRRILDRRRMSAASRLTAQLPEHCLRADEVIVEDATGHLQQIPQGGVAHGVAHRGPLLPGLDDVLGPQDRELLGDGGLVDAEGLSELVHAPLASHEHLEDPDADRVGECLEELGLEHLELPDRGRLPLHVHIYMALYEIRQSCPASPVTRSPRAPPRPTRLRPPRTASRALPGPRQEMSEGFARRSPRATEGRRREEERLGDRARRPPPVRPGRLARPEAARAGTGRPSSRHRGSLRPARAPNATDPTQADRGTPDVRSVADTRKRLPDRSGSSHTLVCRRVTVAAAKGSRAGSVPVR